MSTRTARLNHSEEGQTSGGPPNAPANGGNPSAGLADGCWPTVQQELLLRAALVPGPEATDAWRRWSAVSDLDRLDPSSVHLLPKVYRSIQREGLTTAPDLGRLKGIYRQSWYRNQIVLRDTAPLVTGLAARGVQLLLLGGAAITLRYHRNLGVRPIDDPGILVAKSDVSRALGVLREAGWRPREPCVPAATPKFTRLVDERGGGLDLHWRLLAEDSVPDAEVELWRAATSVEWPGAHALVLDPVHQLLHLCLHGVRWRPVPDLRWIADAAAVLDVAASTLDWDRLVHAASRYHVSLPVLHGLAYLRELLGEVMPAEPIAALARCRTSPRERLEIRLICRAPGALVGSLPQRSVRWLRITHGQGWVARAAGFPAFLAEDLGCRNVAQLARLLLVRAARRITALATEPSKHPLT